MKTIEILSPAGDKKSLYSAFEAGADAVYFGVSEFNARKRAENIRISDLPEIVSEAFLRGINLYLTLNTLISSTEIPAVLDLIDSVMAAGIKSFIIQDYGILNILEKFYPEAEIHISTQVTTHLKGQISFLSRTSASRINLARELSLDEICEYTSFAHDKGMETEVFVHGSYCLSYSGQCYISSFMEGLSGNRGLCAQLCRRIYRKNSGKGYFLNLKDNSALSSAHRLMKCGIDSVKIEGRIKGPEYVYNTVKTWKDIIFSEDENSLSLYKKNLSSVFNRGFSSGYLENNITEMFSDSPSDASYRNVAEVISYSADKQILETEPSLLSIIYSNEENPDFNRENLSGSSYPFEVMLKRLNGKNNDLQYICSGRILSEICPGKYHFQIEGKLTGRIEKGNSVWMRPVSGIIVKEMIQNSTPDFRKIPAAVEIKGRSGELFELTLKYGGKSITACSDNILEKGRNKNSVKDDVKKQIMRFGNTPFAPVSVDFKEFDEDVFIPSSVINKTRRKAVAAFLETIDTGRKETVLEYFNSAESEKSAEGKTAAFKNRLESDKKSSPETGPGTEEKLESVNRYVQLKKSYPVKGQTAGQESVSDNDDQGTVSKKEGCLKGEIGTAFIADDPEISAFLKENGAGEIFYDFSDYDHIPDCDVIPFFPSVMTAGYAGEIIRLIKEKKFSRIVISNTALIEAAEEAECEWIAGNSLNILNYSAAGFFSKFRGFTGFIISPEAGKEEIESLSGRTDEKMYLPFYYRPELMTTRQCLLGMKCGKIRCDENCFSCSCGIEEFTDVKGREIIAEKRKNRFTALYDKKYFFIKNAVQDFKNKNLTFIIDLRIFPDMLSFPSVEKTGQIDKKKELFRYLDAYIKRGDNNTPFISRLIKNTSEGNYRRGLQ